MNTSEKVAYVKGLAEGLGYDNTSKEGKILAAILDILEDVAHDIEDLEENAWDLGEAIDQVSDDLAEIEELVYDEDFDDDEDEDEDEDEDYEPCSCCCGGEAIRISILRGHLPQVRQHHHHRRGRPGPRRHRLPQLRRRAGVRRHRRGRG